MGVALKRPAALFHPPATVHYLPAPYKRASAFIMQKNPKNTSTLGKRSKETTSDEDSSSDPGSGTRSSRHQIKRKCSGPLPQGHERPNPSTSSLGKSWVQDAPSTIENFSSEIPEPVRSSVMQRPHSAVSPDAPPRRQTPKSKALYRRRGSPPSANRKTAHPNKPDRLQKKAAACLDHVDDIVLSRARLESKRKKKRAQNDVPSTSPLEDQLFASKTPDELRAWFEKLGLPYHPESVKNKAPHGKESSTTGSGDKSSQNGKPLTACTFTQAILSKYCNWNFSIIEPEDEISKQSSAKRAYRQRHRCIETERSAILDVEVPPKPDAKHRCLDRDIMNHLMRERYRMLNAEDSLPVLTLPIEWKEQAQGTPPLLYKLPQDFRDNLGIIKKLRSRKGTKKTALKATSESDGSQTDEAPSRAMELSQRELDAELEVRLLCRKERLSSTSKSPERRRRDADKLNEILKAKNLVWRKWDNKVELLRAIDKHDGVKRHLRWMPLLEIKDSDKRHCDGDVTGNEDTTSAVEYPPYIITRFLGYFVNGERVRTEGTVETHVGSLLREVIAAKNVEVSKNGPLKFPRHLSPIGSNPSPDIFVRANDHFRWPKLLAPLFPVVFAAEGKSLRALKPDSVCAQLAAPFHAMLIILILYYLDTRETVSSALPPWLFLYGIEYTELSISITAHYPSYVFDGETGHWELHASILTPDFQDVFVVDDAVKRFCFLAVLFRIRSHSLFVLEQLENWKRAQIVLGPLLGPLVPEDAKSSKAGSR